MKVIFVSKGALRPRGGAQWASQKWFENLSKRVDCALITDQKDDDQSVDPPGTEAGFLLWGIIFSHLLYYKLKLLSTSVTLASPQSPSIS